MYCNQLQVFKVFNHVKGREGTFFWFVRMLVEYHRRIVYYFNAEDVPVSVCVVKYYEKKLAGLWFEKTSGLSIKMA